MSVAILSTGDEVVTGDIQNTTARWIAAELSAHGITVGNHLTVTDALSDLTRGLAFLFAHHQTVICTGGLGPTSDDRTRFAVADFFNEELVFHEPCWTHILERHQRVGITTHENNRIQALFPANTALFPNPRGTAFGGYFAKGKQQVFLLPGPPNECQPMFTDYALPELKRLFPKAQKPLYRWLVFNVPESELGHQVEQALSEVNCEVSYRWYFPYIELKIRVLDDALDKAAVEACLAEAVLPHVLPYNGLTAIQALKRVQLKNHVALAIDDQATQGLLQSLLAETGHSRFVFTTESSDELRLSVGGLDNFWQGNDSNNDELCLTYHVNGQSYQEAICINSKKIAVLKYVVEFIAIRLLNWLSETEQLVDYPPKH